MHPHQGDACYRGRLDDRDDGVPDHEAALWTCSDALAGLRLWTESARFAELAMAADSPGEDRIETAWRLLRAGRVEPALAQLAVLADDMHPVLRAAAVAVRDRTSESLADLLRVVTARPTTPLALRMVVVASLAVGDRATALDAAARLLATVHADDPELRRLTAPGQAMAGDVTAAVASAECAAGGRPTDPAGPVREIGQELRDAGRDDVAYRFLAEGYLRTGRAGYGELLAEALPRRLRNRNGTLLGGVVALLAGIGLAVTGVEQVLLAGLLLMLGGLVVTVREALLRAPGANREQTNRISQAHALFRSRRGLTSLAPPTVGAAAGLFLVAMMFARGSDDTVALPAILTVLGGSAAAGAVVWVVMWVRRRRHRARVVAAEEAQVPGDRCRCWELDWFAGKDWRDYLAEHLEQAAAHERLGAVLRRCPATGKTWLHLPASDLAVAVRLPAEPERSSAGYL